MNAEQRAALRKLAEEATPGPWVFNQEQKVVTNGKLSVETVDGYFICQVDEGKRQQANADHIAAANPSAILQILDYIDQLEEKIDDLVMSLDAAIGE